MISLVLELPEELEATIKDLGFDLQSYFKTVFVNPLLDRQEEVEKVRVLKDFKKEIKDKVKELKDQTSLRKIDTNQPVSIQVEEVVNKPDEVVNELSTPAEEVVMPEETPITEKIVEETI